jgi:biopolymer transport protein ExbD
MRFKTKVKIFRGKMDMTPLLDVMFLLVIFFLISTSYDFQKGFKVELPESEAPLVRGDKLVVVIASKGDSGEEKDSLIFFNNEEVSWENLEVKLAERIGDRSIPVVVNGEKSSRRPTISLKVDKNIPHGLVLRVFALAMKLEVNVNQVVSPAGK